MANSVHRYIHNHRSQKVDSKIRGTVFVLKPASMTGCHCSAVEIGWSDVFVSRFDDVLQSGRCEVVAGYKAVFAMFEDTTDFCAQETRLWSIGEEIDIAQARSIKDPGNH
jgi:hypothetical protein